MYHQYECHGVMLTIAQIMPVMLLQYHWVDLATLEERHPDAYRKLCEGNFAVQRSNKDAVERCMLTAHARATILKNLKKVFGSH